MYNSEFKFEIQRTHDYINDDNMNNALYNTMEVIISCECKNIYENNFCKTGHKKTATF